MAERMSNAQYELAQKLIPHPPDLQKIAAEANGEFELTLRRAADAMRAAAARGQYTFEIKMAFDVSSAVIAALESRGCKSEGTYGWFYFFSFFPGRPEGGF